MPDVVIVGGGVIGLSLAYELARRNLQIELIDRRHSGREASWAGAGILPPPPTKNLVDPLDKLRKLSHELHPAWAAQLRETTGIDTGYRACGGVYLACSRGEAASLHAMQFSSAEVGIEMHRLSADELVRHVPACRALVEGNRLQAAYSLPDESQLRNPDHIRALVAACRSAGVNLRDNVELHEFRHQQGRIVSAETSAGSIHAQQYCVASGAWTYQLLEQLGLETGIFPVRGQMILFRLEQKIFSQVLNEGPRYLVPRDDGRILAGSSEEEVGFEKGTTNAVQGDLEEFACRLIPALRAATVEKRWSGLRPASFDGLPYLGRLPHFENGFVAAGHFRSGIHLSTGTAAVMAELLLGETPQIDLSPLGLSR